MEILSTLSKYLFGIIGLGIVVLVHELGHFLAAKLFGIKVEAFSIGWGKKLVGFKKGDTEYRLSMIPIGGYCKMSGEEAFQEALTEGKDYIEPKDKNSYFSAAPWKRILVSFAGPLFNFIFAIIVLSVIWFVGFSVESSDNRIILTADYETSGEFADMPAARVGMRTGDRIVYINDIPIRNFNEIFENIAVYPEEEITIVVERGGKEISFDITPQLNKTNGTGIIGINNWIDPVIESFDDQSFFKKIGMGPGDRITKFNDRNILNVYDISKHWKELDLNNTLGTVTYERDGKSFTVNVMYPENLTTVSMVMFERPEFRSPEMNLIQAIGKGFTETFKTLGNAIKSISVLFKGVDLGNTLSGPLRITYFVGEVTASTFEGGGSQGFYPIFAFLCLISVALGFTNLLPLPILDGGQILLFLVEWIRGKAIKAKVMYRYQIVGFIIIFTIFIFTLFSDVNHLFVR